MNARVVPLELGEDHRHDGAAGPGRCTELEAAGQLALGLLAELREQLLLHRKQTLRAAVEATAGLGRLDPASRPIEELQAEALLERADLEAHRRLRDAELLGGLREAAPLDDRAERRELSRIHKQSLCTRLSRNHLASERCLKRPRLGPRTRSSAATGSWRSRRLRGLGTSCSDCSTCSSRPSS